MMKPKLRMLAGNDTIETRFTVENLLEITKRTDNHVVVSAYQHQHSLLRSFCQRSDLGCELMISIGVQQAGMNSRVGNLRDWLAGEKPDDLVWVTYTTGTGREWSEKVVGAHFDSTCNRLLLDT